MLPFILSLSKDLISASLTNGSKNARLRTMPPALPVASCCVPVQMLLLTTACRPERSAMRRRPRRCGATCPTRCRSCCWVGLPSISVTTIRESGRHCYAMLRAVNVAGDAGVFALLVHALSDQAKRFYLSRGFVESPLQPMTLFMTIETIRSILAEAD